MPSAAKTWIQGVGFGGSRVWGLAFRVKVVWGLEFKFFSLSFVDLGFRACSFRLRMEAVGISVQGLGSHGQGLIFTS